MNKTITTAEARKNFADIVNTVAYGKEPVVLTRRGQEIAALISIEELQLLQKGQSIAQGVQLAYLNGRSE